MNTSKVLVIDDDKELCALIKRYLESDNFFVDCSYSGLDGEKKALEQNWELVILDIMLPGKNGFDILSELRKKSNVPVLILTARDNEIDKISGLRLGADDYITKPFSMNECIARVHSLVRRYTILNGLTDKTNNILRFNNKQSLEIDPFSHSVKVNGKDADLTAKEFDILYLMASNKGRVFTKKQLYSSVWNDGFAFDDNNIMVHIRRLRKKIELDPENPSYICTVWGVGYKFCTEQNGVCISA